MAVDANTYGSVTGIERLIGDIVGSRTFSGSTVPPTTQVEAELDAVAAEINAHLDAHGYTTIIDSTDYPHAYNAAVAANNYGAASRLLTTIPVMSFDPEGPDNSRAAMYEKRLKAFLEKIEKGQLRAGMRRTRFDNFVIGSRYDDDGNEKLPIFTRGQFDYPGRRSLVDS